MTDTDRLFNDMKIWGNIKLNILMSAYKKDRYLICPEDNHFRIFDDLLGITPVAIILGQDPYPQRETATGIAFANFKREGEYRSIPLSPSLEVIKNSVMKVSKGHFDETLMSWVKQGIIPINSSWTVLQNKPGSMTNFWIPYTAGFLRKLSALCPDLCYILLGNTANAFRGNILNGNILTEYHPSFFARMEKEMPPRVWIKMIEWVDEKFNRKIHLTDE